MLIIGLGLNIGADKEAAEHFLSALSLQESAGITNDSSDTLWSTLRKAFYGMVCSFLLLNIMRVHFMCFRTDSIW